MKKLYLLVAVVGTMISVAPKAHATLLFSGSPVGNTTSSLTGTMVADTGVVAFQGKNALGTTVFSGNLREVVYQEASGSLDFYYQVQVTSPPARADIGRVTVSDFTGFTTIFGTASNVALLGTTGTRSPVANNLLFGTISFNWDPANPILPGQTSLTMIVSTNATNFTQGTISLIDSGTANVVGFAPDIAAVPEPASIVLFGTVVGLTALITRRKMARKG